MAPPPSNADAKAASCERLVSDPTTSSGEGMASAGLVPKTAADSTVSAAKAAISHRRGLVPGASLNAIMPTPQDFPTNTT